MDKCLNDSKTMKRSLSSSHFILPIAMRKRTSGMMPHCNAWKNFINPINRPLAQRSGTTLENLTCSINETTEQRMVKKQNDGQYPFIAPLFTFKAAKNTINCVKALHMYVIVWGNVLFVLTEHIDAQMPWRMPITYNVGNRNALNNNFLVLS